MRDDLAAWAAAHLTGERIALPPLSIEALSVAIAVTGTGPDHLVGEEVLALVDESSARGTFTLGAIVTDARLVVRSEGRTTVVRFGALEGAEALEGLVTTGLRVRAGGAGVRWPFGVETSRAMAAFLGAIVEAPPDSRTPAPCPLAHQSALDSTGLAGVRAGLASTDPRPPVLVDLALRAHERGELGDELARDFAARAALYDRSLAFGRGAHDGWWLSPLGGPDVVHALSAILGAPASVADAGGVRSAAFRTSGPGRSLSLRCRISPGAGMTAFTTAGDGDRPLSEVAPERLRALLDGLVPLEGRCLVRRLIAGWEPAPEALAAIPIATIETRIREALGQFEFATVFGLP